VGHGPRADRYLDLPPQLPTRLQVREVAAELEELGYGALWIGEAAYREPLTHAGFLLSATNPSQGLRDRSGPRARPHWTRT
jgi:alkanesulfonate monooxygenase SsuD/methylene tetrahydromethanopterin reductase-like flavin-dependent oxidoreductase (luciferase family)